LKNTTVLPNDKAFFNTLRNPERIVRSKHNANVDQEPTQSGVNIQANGATVKKKEQLTAALWHQIEGQ
jgi:16S rRNA U516 pseudouridylate synthase RsuA-like enzyme